MTWGSTFESKRASNDSCSYANASLQHENFNRDEWRVPERVVEHFDRDLNDKITIFTGPIFTESDRWYKGVGLEELVRIPAGFWKVIVYIGKKSKKLECQAYAMYQDALFLRDKRGQHNLDIRNYQVTITEIEYLTGLEFSKELFDSNPLYFYPREGINEGPEGFITPKSTDEEDLKTGVIFTRKDAESKSFRVRRRDIKMDVFEDLINGVKLIRR